MSIESGRVESRFLHNAPGQSAPVSEDTDGDQTTDRITQYHYESDAVGADLVRVTVQYGSVGEDETFVPETQETWYYDGTGEDYDYIIYDGTEGGDAADGTGEWLEYRGGADFEHVLDGAQTGLAGVQAVQLSGRGGATTLTLSDGDLTELANGADGYVVKIDGGRDDTVVFSGNIIYATGLVVNGRREFQGTDGKVYVANAVAFRGARDPREVILSNLAEATVDMFGLLAGGNGIVGVTADNLDSVKTVIGAYGSATSPALADLTEAQIVNLAGVVSTGRAVPSGGRVLTATLQEDNVCLRLEVDANGDSTIDQRVGVTLDGATLAVIGLTRSMDSNGDGVWDDRSEVDSNYDGTVDQVITVGRTKTDSDSDGTAERIVTKTFIDGTLRIKATEEDIDDDSTVDTEETLYYDGTGEPRDDGTGVPYDYAVLDGSGTSDRQDGTADRLEYKNGIDFTHTIYGTGREGLVGMRRIMLADGEGDITLTFADGALEGLAANVDNYTLTIDGDSGDTVVFSDDVYNTGVQEGSHDVYRGESVRVLVNSEVEVMGEQDALEALLANLDDATVGMFERVGDEGIAGVTSDNLALVKVVLGVFGSATTPPLTDLTEEQVQNLALIASSGFAVPASSAVMAASVSQNNLVLKVDLNGDGTEDQRSTVSLATGTMAMTDMLRVYDSDSDGDWDSRSERDVYDDGTRQSKAVRTDSDGDEIFERIETETYQASRLHTYKVERDLNDDGTIDTAETQYYDGTGSRYDYALFDGDGTNDPADGTGEWLEYRSGTNYDRPFDGAEVGVAGVQAIQLAGRGGVTTLKFSDSDLTELANGVGGYMLRIDGDADDLVKFSGGIYDTGQHDGDYEVYRGTSGTVLVDADVVGVSGTSDALSALRMNISKATVEMFGLVGDGITGVSKGNLAAVRTLLGEYVDSTAIGGGTLTEAQVGALVSIVNDVENVPEGAEIATITAVAGNNLVLEMTLPVSGGSRMRVELGLNVSSYAITRTTRKFDEDGDGTYELIEHDHDADGILDVVEHDEDDDGTVEYKAYDDGIGSGGDDGTPDRLEVLTGGAPMLIIGADMAEEFALVARIEMANDVSNVSGVTLVNGVLDRPADHNGDGTVDSVFTLTVVGGTNDTLAVGDTAVVREESSDTAGFNAYRGSSGLLMVDEDVTVDFAPAQAVRSIRSDPANATTAMFADIGIDGLSDRSLANVKMLIGAFDSDSTPAHSELTYSQIHNLVEIASDTRVVNADGTVTAVSLSEDGMTVDINTDADNVIEERSVLNLDAASLALLDQVKWYDLFGDGTFDVRSYETYNSIGQVLSYDFVLGRYLSSERYTYKDGALNAKVTEKDYDGDGTVDRRETYTYHSTGERASKITLFDNDDDGTMDGRSNTTYNDRGFPTYAEHDSGIDGTMESRETWIYHSTGELKSNTTVRDVNHDGTADTQDQRYSESGKLISVEFDSGTDGTVDTTTHGYNDKEQLVSTKFDRESDGTIERRVDYTYHSNGERHTKIQQEDNNGDGTFDRRREESNNENGKLVSFDFYYGNFDYVNSRREITYFASGRKMTDITRYDNDDDGVFDRKTANTYNEFGIIRTDSDYDFDGTIDYQLVYTYHDNGYRATYMERQDNNDDGTVGLSITYTYNESGQKIRSEIDLDDDGTPYFVWVDADADGYGEMMSFSWGDSGTVNYRIYDGTGSSDDDGTPDRLVFTDETRFSMRLGGPEARTASGISTIELAGEVDRSTTLEIQDEDLTVLSAGLSEYRLVVRGTDSDTLRIGAGISRITGEGALDGDRTGYEGSHGRIYVDPEVAVEHV